MNELILKLTFFASMQNVMHNYSIPGKYQVLRKFSMHTAPEPHDILFECPMEVLEAFNNLTNVISHHYVEHRMPGVNVISGEEGYGGGHAEAEDQQH